MFTSAPKKTIFTLSVRRCGGGVCFGGELAERKENDAIGGKMRQRYSFQLVVPLRHGDESLLFK